MTKILIIFILELLSVQNIFAVQRLALPDLSTSQNFMVKGNIILPQGQKLNKSAPSNITVLEKTADEWKEVASIKLAQLFTVKEVFPYSFMVHTKSGNSSLKITASLYHCDRVKNNFCVIDDFEGELHRHQKTNNTSLSLDLKGNSPH